MNNDIFKITQNILGCTIDETKIGFLGTQEILLSKKYNLKICTFLNKSDHPYICIYDSIYTSIDDVEQYLPNKILRLSLIGPYILRYNVISDRVSEWVLTDTEFVIIINIINIYWKYIRDSYLLYLTNKYNIFDLPKESPYKNIAQKEDLIELSFLSNYNCKYDGWIWID